MSQPNNNLDPVTNEDNSLLEANLEAPLPLQPQMAAVILDQPENVHEVD